MRIIFIFFFFATAFKAENFMLKMLKSRIDRKWRQQTKNVVAYKPKLYQLYF